MNECTQCYGSGESFAVGSNLPYTKFRCSKCNGTGQDNMPPNDINSIIQMNPIEFNTYIQNQPLIFHSNLDENYFKIIKEKHSQHNTS